jgi:hypothetical protein
MKTVLTSIFYRAIGEDTIIRTDLKSRERKRIGEELVAWSAPQISQKKFLIVLSRFSPLYPFHNSA